MQIIDWKIKDDKIIWHPKYPNRKQRPYQTFSLADYPIKVRADSCSKTCKIKPGWEPHKETWIPSLSLPHWVTKCLLQRQLLRKGRGRVGRSIWLSGKDGAQGTTIPVEFPLAYHTVKGGNIGNIFHLRMQSKLKGNYKILDLLCAIFSYIEEVLPT